MSIGNGCCGNIPSLEGVNACAEVGNKIVSVQMQDEGVNTRITYIRKNGSKEWEVVPIGSVGERIKIITYLDELNKIKP